VKLWARVWCLVFLTHSVDIWGNILFWGRIQIPIWYKVVVLCGVPRTITISIYLVTQVTIYQHFTQTDGQLSQLKKLQKMRPVCQAGGSAEYSVLVTPSSVNFNHRLTQ